MLWLPFLGNLILSVGIVGGLIGKESGELYASAQVYLKLGR